MARSKQAAPLRRAVSSEYTSKADRTPRKPEHDGSLSEKTNGYTVSSKAVAEPKQAGIPQLIMAVGGIYASLYALAQYDRETLMLTVTYQSHMGLPPRTPHHHSLRPLS
jgi:hypothetical protein